MINSLKNSVPEPSPYTDSHSLEVPKAAYFVFFESHLNCDIVIWGGAACSVLERVLIHQKRAVRYLVGLNFKKSCQTEFTKLKTFTVVSLYIIISQIELDKGDI